MLFSRHLLAESNLIADQTSKLALEIEISLNFFGDSSCNRNCGDLSWLTHEDVEVVLFFQCIFDDELGNLSRLDK